jgi:hypothetical protein
MAAVRRFAYAVLCLLPLLAAGQAAAAQWLGTSPHDRAGSISQLSERQQAVAPAPSEIADEPDWLFDFLMALAVASIPGYVCLQIFMLLRYSGGWRVAAGFPLIGTIPLAIYTLAALAMGSNLWPLMMLFLAPPAFLYLVGLLIVRMLARGLAPS